MSPIRFTMKIYLFSTVDVCILQCRFGQTTYLTTWKVRIALLLGQECKKRSASTGITSPALGGPESSCHSCSKNKNLYCTVCSGLPLIQCPCSCSEELPCTSPCHTDFFSVLWACMNCTIIPIWHLLLHHQPSWMVWSPPRFLLPPAPPYHLPLFSPSPGAWTWKQFIKKLLLLPGALGIWQCWPPNPSKQESSPAPFFISYQ